MTGIPIRGPNWHRALAAGVYACLAIAAVWAAVAIPWRSVEVALLRADKAWLGAGLVVCSIAVPIVGFQWALFVPRNCARPFSQIVRLSVLTTFARATLPFLTGDASSIGLLVVQGGMSPGAAVSILALDQLFTGIGKVLMVLATLWIASLPPLLFQSGLLLAVCVGSGLLVLVLAAFLGGRLGRVPGRTQSFLARIVAGISSGAANLEMLKSPLRTSGAAAAMVLRKLVEIGVTLAVQRAVGIHLPIWSALLFVTAIDLAGFVPGPPAGLGVFEATAIFIYRYLGVPPGIALAAAVLQHAIYLACDIGYGYLALLAGKLSPIPEGLAEAAPALLAVPQAQPRARSTANAAFRTRT